MYHFAVKVSNYMYKLILSLPDFPTRLGVRTQLTPGNTITEPVCSRLSYGLVLIMILPRYPDMVGRPHRRPSYMGGEKWRGFGVASVVQQRS